MALLAEIIKQKRSAANLGSKYRRCQWGVERNASRQVDAFRSAGHWVGAVSGMESVWHRPTVCYAKPQAQEVAATQEKADNTKAAIEEKYRMMRREQEENEQAESRQARD